MFIKFKNPVVNMFKVFSISFFMCIYNIVSAQSLYNQQLWTDFNFSSFVSKRTAFVGSFAYRTELNNLKWSQFMIRPSVKYSVSSNWKILGGVAFYDKFSQYEDFENEIRFYQGTINILPLTNLFWFKNYLRLEERFSPNNSWDFTLRIRNRLTVDVNLVNNVKRKISIPLSGEVFFDIEETSSNILESNRVRFFTGINYRYYDKWDLKLLYAIQGNKKSEEQFNQTDVIYRVRLYFYIRKSAYYTKRRKN